MQHVVMRHVVGRCVIPASALFFLAATAVQAQTPGPIHSPFEVASIKPNPNCHGGGGIPKPGWLNVVCVDARDLVAAAWSSATPLRLAVLEGPAWVDSETYDVHAKAADERASVLEMWGTMLQSLLEDRFKLKVHKETREFPVYSFTIAKNGLGLQSTKLQPTKPGTCITVDFDHLPAPPEPGQPMRRICGQISEQKNGTTSIIDVRGTTLARFGGRALRNSVDRPILDKTGLDGLFDIHLEFAADGREAGDLSAPSIFTAVQEQLGLKLSADKGPIEVLVIDQIERPTEN